MKLWNLTQMAVAALAASGMSVAAVDYTSNPAAAPSPSPLTNATPIRTITPAQVNLPPFAAEALRMSEAGISDEVITSYIQSSASAYTLDADQIVYLRDVGISSAVLNALVTHSQTAANGQAETSSGASGT